jgi:hypothetical protein
MRDTQKCPAKPEHRNRSKPRPQQTWKEGIQKVLKERGMEWNGRK